MNWEENTPRAFERSTRVIPRGQMRGFETDRQSGGTAQLPSLAHYMNAQGNAIPEWHMPKLQSIQREPICEDDYEELEQDDAEESDNDALLTSGPKHIVKRSRYLREGDRRCILLRIDKGEKQSDLAKEYRVTRAAICYLKKHRNAVLARTNANPLAKHPKKSRPAVKHVVTPPSSIDVPSNLPAASFALPSLTAFMRPRQVREAPASHQKLVQQPTEQHTPFVHEIKTRSMELLLTKIESIETLPAEFQRNISRMMHLLAEEALASVAVVPFNVLVSRNEHVDGYSIANPSCAISMMAAACPMLSILSQLEPKLPSGYARVNHVSHSFYSNVMSVELTSSSLPATLKHHNTFVMDLVSGSGHQLCAVISKLLERGASSALVMVVSLFASSDAIAMVHERFPGVRFLAVQVDPPMDTTSTWPRCPSLGRHFWKWFARLYDPRLSCALRSQS